MKIQYDIEARRQIGEIFKYGKVKFGIQIALKYKEKLREKINSLTRADFVRAFAPRFSSIRFNINNTPFTV